MENLESIADKIKKYRKLKNMSQETLAKLSGINVSTIKKYETGNRNPKPDQLEKIATALEISMNAFISYELNSINDVIAEIIKLKKQTNMVINSEKDESGNIIPSSITISFEDQAINVAIANYLNNPDDMTIDYVAINKDLDLNIDIQKDK